MNKLLIFVCVLLFINCETIRKSVPCKCSQMLIQVDCQKNKDCIWDQSKKECIDYKIEMYQSHFTYCNQFISKEICTSIYSCTWDENRCTHFTGCTAFVYDTHQKCQAISQRCISDGSHCVEIGDCYSYLNPIACINNSAGQYCYWNSTQAKCQDADECSRLPQALGSDSLCRAQISKCTAQIGGGCVEEGNNCYDQDDQINCVYNKKNNQICFWLDGKCLDKICDNASQTLKTDKECEDFLPSCTTKYDGGCTTRTFCQDYLIKEACKKDAVGKDCFWTGIKCVVKICENALKSYTTNEKCQKYLDTCITNGKGCVLNTSCEVAIIEEACYKTIDGTQCHWNGSACLPKICKNAGPLYVGHAQCTNFMETCTASKYEITGCTDRTCDNAPLSFNTYTQCFNYIQNGNCIPIYGGGCKINTKCQDNKLKEGCVIDVNNQECFWWKDKCQQKTCENAPKEFNTHEQCNEFMKTCTIGLDQICVSLTCENVQEKSNCNFNLNNKPCIYNEGCFKKFCALAPQNLKYFNQCQSYLSSCTLDNSGSGCMELPIICEAITRIEGCYLIAGRKECSWYQGVCIDKSCQTAPQSLNTTFECSNYMVGCVVNNDLVGCMKSPNFCQQLKHSQNCEYEQLEGLKPRCFWGKDQQLNEVCFDVKCENAQFNFQFQVTQDDCWKFFGLKCIYDEHTNRCITRPKFCLGLGFSACTQSGVLVNDQNCYWDVLSNSCNIYSCSSITLQIYSHDSCQQVMQQCTVNNQLFGCTDLLECTQYVRENQCVFSKDKNKCIWFNQKCIDIPCEQEFESLNFDQCQSISKKCVPTSQKCFLKKLNCEDFKQKNLCEQSTIDWKSICLWTGWSCEKRIDQYQMPNFDCHLVKAIGLTLSYCQSISYNYCSVNVLGTSCIQNDYCLNYREDQCFWGKDGWCIWIDDQCKKNIYCEFAKPPYTYDTCRIFYDQCTLKIDGSGCVKVVDTCQNTALENCTNSQTSICYKKQLEDICIPIWQQSLQQSDCYTVKGKGLTLIYCLWISNYQCSVNASGTSCVPMRSQCQEYNKEECRYYNQRNCIFSETLQQCIEFQIGFNSCADIILYQLEGYSDLLCKEFDNSCNAYPDGSGCYSNVIPIPRVDCQKAVQPVTYYNCFSFSNFCSVDAAKTKCIPAKNTCAEYSLIDCNHSIDEGECIISGQSCIQKGCHSDPNIINTFEDCLQISSNCAYSEYGCYNKRECNKYKQKKSCVINTLGEDCLWNPTTAKCLDKTCNNAEASEYFDSHQECIQIGRCTVKASINDTIGQGCIPWGSCRSYVIIEQCVKNSQNQNCVWNTNIQPAQCNDMSCETAELFRVNHEACEQYLNICTVRVIEIEGMYINQGCIPFKYSCDQYIHQNQCVIDASGNICGWNGNSCENQSCNTAPTYINLPQLCQQYQDGCTIHPSNCGCTKIPDTCEEMTQNQCYYGSMNNQQQECYWDQKYMRCILKTCDIMSISNSEDECYMFLSYCTMNEQRCRNAICEDYSLTTDQECSNIMSTCTTNGVYCVKRSSCLLAQSKSGCVTDSKGRQCAWINGFNQQSHCAIKECETAPLDLITEQQCQEYYQPKEGSCTTTKFGGCVLKGTCFDANIQAACTTSKNRELCFWDENLNICRIKQCQDYLGTTHQECKSKKKECTIGFNSKCVKITTCQETKFKAACIEGTDGSCLWINKYKNTDNSLGACFQYNQCQSLKWNSHALCQQISKKCTTDGYQCVPITNCEETNLKGGCVIGIDNQGIQKCIVTTESKDQKNPICKTFNKCTDINYLTHNECYQVSSQCTSDYKNGCIPLQPCYLYKYEQCYINHLGIIKDAQGFILSYGICIWDQMASLCRDEECSDIIFTTHLECQSRLANCTTNGKKCVFQEPCQSYLSQGVCENAEGKDGKCIWESRLDKPFQQCRRLNCEDLPNGNISSSCRQLENCISNGLYCINKAKCSDYNTKQTCYSEGLDGICVSIENQSQNNITIQCKLMESCESAKNDQNACKLVKDKCYWNSITSLCQTHTCQTYSAQVRSCKNFYSWDNNQIHLCHYHEQQCVTTIINTLQSTDCYIKTAKLYRWDPYRAQCTSCEKTVRLITESSDILGHILLILLVLIY